LILAGRPSLAIDDTQRMGFWHLAAGEWNVRAFNRENFAGQNIVVERISD